MGSRGESCADCILNKRNEHGMVNGRANKCQPSTGLLFAICEVGFKTNKNVDGIDWRPVSTLKNEDDDFIYDGPVIINVETTKSTHGSGNKENILFDITNGKVGLATVSSGGPKYIPDDVEMFFPYWQTLLATSSIQEAPKGDANFPEHPQLPYIITARTEMYLAPTEKSVAYAKSCPVFRTEGNALTDPDALTQLVESINAYVTTYEGYVKDNNITDKSYEVAKDETVPALAGGKIESSLDDGEDFNPSVFKAG